MLWGSNPQPLSLSQALYNWATVLPTLELYIGKQSRMRSHIIELPSNKKNIFDLEIKEISTIKHMLWGLRVTYDWVWATISLNG